MQIVQDNKSPTKSSKPKIKLKPKLNGEKNTDPATESAIKILKQVIYATNTLFLISPCKWNKKAQKFKIDTSWFLTLCRLGHLLMRCTALLAFLIFLLLFETKITYWDLFMCVCGGCLFSASLPVHISIWKSPDTFSTVINALLQLNRNCSMLYPSSVLLLIWCNKYQMYLLFCSSRPM